MPYPIIDVEDRRYGTSSTVIEQSEMPSNFPMNRWNAQRQRYLDYWRHFTGEVWNETENRVDANGEPIYRYPLKINFIKTAARTHNYMLWGEILDEPGPLVPLKVSPKPQDDEEDEAANKAAKKVARKLENFVNDVWAQNHGNVLQYENGLVSQFLGGAFFQIRWDPDNPELDDGIKLEMVLPDFVLPVWDTSDPDTLLEVWIVYRLPAAEVKERFGVEAMPNVPFPIYVEHWTRSTITIQIGGQYVQWGQTIFDNAPNPWGFVPFVYIPRERSGNYYGMSIVDDLDGLSREMNARYADLGDAIRDSVWRTTWVKNVTGTIKTMNIPGNRDAINLGNSNPALGNADPNIGVIDPPELDANLVHYPNTLFEQFGRDASVPPVAYGQDEGSQRSALTLAFRMWPLTSAVRAQRNRWTNGLIQVGKMILRMAAIMEVRGITLKMIRQCNYACMWPDMVPRDREQDVNETVLAVQTNMLAPIDGNKRLRLSTDPEDAADKVVEWMEFMSKLQTDAAMQQQQAKQRLQTPTASSGAEQENS